MSEFKTAESWTEKYRPKTLDDVIGQKAALAQIKGMIKQKQVPSTILITGKTGLGKSSLAFLIAYAINELPYGTHTQDIHDFNVGAEGGKDDVLQILKVSNYKPSGNFRVIILDEVHRLTPQAASALLKPLEKPPANTVWILVTDQPEKLLAPLIGRSVQMALQPVEPEDIVPRLKTICKKEKIDYLNDKMLLEIARNANAQPRASVGLLQATVNAYHGSGKDIKVAINLAIESLGAGVDLLAAKIISCVLMKRSKGLVSTLRKVKANEFVTLSTYLLFHSAFLIDKAVDFPTWENEARKKLIESLTEKPSLKKLVKLHETLVAIKIELMKFQAPEYDLILSKLLSLTGE